MGIPAFMLPQVLDGALIHSQVRTDDRRNMGIGLSVCRSIVRAHGGECTVGKSQAHGGVSVRFYLPCEERGA